MPDRMLTSGRGRNQKVTDTEGMDQGPHTSNHHGTDHTSNHHGTAQNAVNLDTFLLIYFYIAAKFAILILKNINIRAQPIAADEYYQLLFACYVQQISYQRICSQICRNMDRLHFVSFLTEAVFVIFLF